MDEATIQYRLNLAHALHSISPALSALHTSRVAALHPELTAVVQPTHCPKCGTYYFSGDHPSYLVAKKRKRMHTALQRLCHSCGSSTTIDHPSVRPSSGSSKTGTAPLISPATEIRPEPPPNNVSRAGTPRVPPLSNRESQPKRASTLKNMLSRDRQREDDAKSSEKGYEGLAAFLKEL